VVTGLGPVTCGGIGKDAFWKSLTKGKSGIDRISSFDPKEFPSQIAGEVKDFQPAEFMSGKTAASAARFAQLAVTAGRLAYEDAGISLDGSDPYRMGACMGSSAQGMGDIIEKNTLLFYNKGIKSVHPLTCVEYTTHIATAYLSIELSLRGPITTLSAGCSTALDAINWGYDQIIQGNADIILAGASDAPIFPGTYATFCAVRVLSQQNQYPTKACRPYDAKRAGLVLSEAGAAVVLEELNHALARRAMIYGEILGFASVSEAKEKVAVEISGESLAHAINLSLKSANLNASDIDYINAHGNSMVDYDISETNAFKTALGEHAYRIPITSIKSMVGQSLAPSSALQVISSCLSLQDDIIPPTINYKYPDPECDLDYVPNQARFNRVNTILMNSHSVGGTHSVLIMGRLKKHTP